MAYCDVDCNWAVTGSDALSSIIIYRSEEDREDGSPLPHSALNLEVPQDYNDDIPPCLLTICRRHPPYSIKISAVDVLCTARTMEVYSPSGEYLETSHGTFVGEMEDGGGNLYLLQYSFENDVEKCQLKLLSMKSKTSLMLHSIHLTVATDPSPHDPLASLLAPPPSVDLDKVRRMLGQMDHQLPAGAQKLLNSVDMYQKSQQAASAGPLGNMLGALQSLPSAASGDQCPPQLSSLMAMMAAMAPVPTPHVQEQPKQPQLDDASEATNSAGHEENDTTEASQEDIVDNHGHGNKTSYSGDTNNEACLSALESRLLACVKETENRIVENVTRQLQQMESRLQQRLDVLLEAVVDSRSNNKMHNCVQHTGD